MIRTTTGATSEEDPTIAVLCLETNANTWAALQNQLPPVLFQSVLDSILVFSNAFLACRHDNAIAVVAASEDSSRLIYSSEDHENTTGNLDPSKVPASTYLRHWQMGESVANRLKDIFSRIESRGTDSSILQANSSTHVALSGALSVAVSYINKISKVRDLVRLRSRILVLSVSTDAAEQYIPLMNCFFAAQKMGIPIDVCRLRTNDSVMLQQAASITNGVYLKSTPDTMLQHLLFAYLPDHFSRGYLRPLANRNVDFRAACFCHRKVIDVGYVCSVCLSIFCEPEKGTCSTCGTKLSGRRLNE